MVLQTAVFLNIKLMSINKIIKVFVCYILVDGNDNAIKDNVC